MTAEWRAQIERVACPYCGAAAGLPCRNRRTDEAAQYPHSARRCVMDGTPLTGHQLSSGRYGPVAS